MWGEEALRGRVESSSKKESNPVASVVRYGLSTFSICQRILFPDQATILLYITYIDLQRFVFF